MKMNRYLSQCVLLVCIAASTNAYPGIQLLMQIPGIDGEYQGEPFVQWIEVNRFSGDISQGGCDVFYVEKALDSTSAAVLTSTALGTLFEAITVVVRQPGLDASPFVSSRFFLNNAVIANISQSGSSGDDYPSETLTIAPGDLVLETYKQNSDGSVSLAGQANVQCAKVKRK